MKTNYALIALLVIAISGLSINNAYTQKVSGEKQKQAKDEQQASSANQQDQGFNELEKTQDSIENLYIAVYDILDRYPDAQYEYVYSREESEIDSVIISGIPDQPDKELLEVYLVDLIGLKEQMKNLHNRVGIYYFAEKNAKPELGYQEFHARLHNEFNYPDPAENASMSGTVFAKFIVDPKGEIDTVFISETFDKSYDWIINDIVHQVRQAIIESSGEWEPATIGGIPVAQWVVLPVQFRFDDTHYGLFW